MADSTARSGVAVTVKPFEATTESNRPQSPRGGSRLFRLALIATVGALALGFIACGLYTVYGYDRVYGGVTVQGVDVGELSRDEAAAKLTAVLNEAYNGQNLQVSAAGQNMTLRTEDLSVRVSGEEAADAAYAAGREGGFFKRLGFVLGSYGGKTEVQSGDGYYIDRDAVTKAAAEFCAAVDSPALDFTWEVTPESVEIRGGIEGRSLDSAMLTEAILHAFASRNFTPLVVEPETYSPAPCPIEDIYENVYSAPADAYLDKETAQFVADKTGVSFNLEEAQKALNSGYGGYLSIPLVYTKPERSLQTLQDSLFRDLLSEAVTSTSSSTKNRAANIALAAEQMDGTILCEGDEFSYNAVVGERTAERGFKMAGSYLNGKVVDSIGGGICQTSSTLYVAALHANLKIINRQNHSMTVSYVPRGQDATVDWQYIDFVFANDTGYPLQIRAWHEEKKLHIQIWGTKTDDLTVSIERDDLTTTPYETVYEENASLAPGTQRTKESGHNGYKVQTYRVLTDAQGNVVSREKEALSTYRKSDKVVEVGPAVDKPVVSVTPEPNPAPPYVPQPEPTPAPPTESEPTPDDLPEATPEPTEALPPDNDAGAEL